PYGIDVRAAYAARGRMPRRFVRLAPRRESRPHPGLARPVRVLRPELLFERPQPQPAQPSVRGRPRPGAVVPRTSRCGARSDAAHRKTEAQGRPRLRPPVVSAADRRPRRCGLLLCRARTHGDRGREHLKHSLPRTAFARRRGRKLLPKIPDEVLVGINDRHPQLQDLYRINIRTGERRLVYENEGMIGFFPDLDLNVRFVYAPTADAVIVLARG